jgi:hypothetical protein
VAFGVSPDGRYLAVGNDANVNDFSNERFDQDAYGALQVWELASGRCVNVLPRVEGSFFSDNCPSWGQLRWHPSGARVGAVFATNLFGIFDPFGTDSEPTAFLQPWAADHGMAWSWSPDGGWSSGSTRRGWTMATGNRRIRKLGYP